MHIILYDYMYNTLVVCTSSLWERAHILCIICIHTYLVHGVHELNTPTEY